MLFLTLALDSVVVENRLSILLSLLAAKDTSLLRPISNGQYEEVCKEGLWRDIPEAIALGCGMYGDMLSNSAMYDEEIRMYGYALEGLSDIRVEEERVPVILGDEGMMYLSKEEIGEVLELLRADIYNNLGNAYGDKGEYDRAIEYYNKALSIRLKTLGPEHPYVATVYENLAEAYEKKGDKKKAEEYRKKARGINVEDIGDAYSLNNRYSPKSSRIFNSWGFTFGNSTFIVSHTSL